MYCGNCQYTIKNAVHLFSICTVYSHAKSSHNYEAAFQKCTKDMKEPRSCVALGLNRSYKMKKLAVIDTNSCG